MEALSPEQARALAESVERLSVAVQILALRTATVVGTQTSDEVREMAGKVNYEICDAFPWLRQESSS